MTGYSRCSSQKYMQPSPANAEEMEQLRRRAWTEQGVLTICPSDPKLTEDQRNFLFMIAEARYGYGGSKCKR